MSNATTANDTTTPTEDSTITDTQLDTILDAVAALHTIVATRGKPLPAFEDCSESDYETVLQRARHEMTRKGAASRAASAAAVKASVETILDAHLNALLEKRARIAAIVEANPDLKDSLGEPPSSAKCPLFALKAAFPEGTSDKDAILVLRDLGYDVSMGDQRLKTPESPYVRVSVAPPKEVAPASTKAA
jgi:hypothetical protein